MRNASKWILWATAALSILKFAYDHLNENGLINQEPVQAEPVKQQDAE